MKEILESLFSWGSLPIQEHWTLDQDDKYLGVDLDGTLAQYDGFKGKEHIGDPIPLMKEKVMKEIESGRTVKIFTARAHDPAAIPYIEDWLLKHGFGRLPITNIKDPGMEELWDDRAKQVIKNTGKFVGEE